MIGKACLAKLPYYDRSMGKMNFKARPCLVIGKADVSDYIILPISSISDKSKIDMTYDIPLDNSIFTFLNNLSYLRTHKQTVINLSSLGKVLVDFKKDYEDEYILALSKVEEFQSQMIDNAL